MKKTPLAVVILAAGKGTRMKSDKPKVLHELAGLPMVNWLLASAEGLAPERMVVVVGPDMEELVNAVKPCEVVVQKKRDGTAGALRAALPALKGFVGEILVLLGDVPLVSAQTMEQLITARQSDEKAGIAVLGVEMENPFGYGRLIVNKKGHILRIREEKDASPSERTVKLINTGVICIDSRYAERWLAHVENKNAQSEYYLTDLPEIALRVDNVPTLAVVGADVSEVKGCSTYADLAALEKIAQERMRNYFLLNGVYMVAPETVYFHYDTTIAPGVRIEPNVFFGPGVQVEEDVHIRAFSHIEGAKIGKSSIVGPFARLRPGTKIEENVRIGNFVEVKESIIGKRSKINHLGYVGDCEMGDDVNFSCGAITVNYDGFEKHKTIIGKGVMIGSNVSLVAPVRIDDGAFVAAGTTITEDVPADALSVGRAKSEIRAGWAAAYKKKNEKKKKK